jgi:hypothetical protein
MQRPPSDDEGGMDGWLYLPLYSTLPNFSIRHVKCSNTTTSGKRHHNEHNIFPVSSMGTND